MPFDLIVTFSTTRFTDLKAARRSAKGSDADRKPTPIDRGALPRGLVVRIDWLTKCIRQYAIADAPSGIIPLDIGFAILCFNKIVILDCSLHFLDEISHPLFNCLHSGTNYGSGFVVASSGIDSLLFLDSGFRVTHVWSALEHGFLRDPSGEARILDMTADHRHVYYPTSTHTTHVNSVIAANDTYHLCLSLFQQGSVIKIDGAGNVVGTILKGLRYPHSLVRVNDQQYLLSNTAAGSVVGFDEHSFIHKRVTVHGCNWLQDAKVLSLDRIVCCDASQSKVIEMDYRGKVYSEWCYDREWKVYECQLADR